jgi:glycyl-tRNA synthetase (class II)
MANDTNRFQAIISHCKEYGFIFPSSEIYDGLQAVYDYGQMGSELKKNIKDYWWKSMTQLQDNIVGIDSAIFMHPTIWKASGHVDNFNDPMIDNLDSKKRYRVDHLIEEFAETLNAEGKTQDAENLLNLMNAYLAINQFLGLEALIRDYNIKCSISGTANWTNIRQFNLMFSTQNSSIDEDQSPPRDKNEWVLFDYEKTNQKLILKQELEAKIDINSLSKNKITENVFKIGKYYITSDPFYYTISKETSELYLRPETAQGIFVNFLNVQKTGRMKIPFGIAQIGKAFRNDCSSIHFQDAGV